MRNWYPKAKSIYEFHNQKLAEFGQNYKTNGSKKEGWSFRESAKALGISLSYVYKLYRAYRVTLQWPEYKDLTEPEIGKLLETKEIQNFLRT